MQAQTPQFSSSPPQVATTTKVEVDDDPETVEERLLLAALVESSNDAILSTTLDGVITTWNPAAERTFGYTAAEVVGVSKTFLYPTDRINEGIVLMERLLRGERIEHFESVRLRKDGAPIDVSLTLSPIRNRMGEIIGMSVIARDIGLQKQYAEERRYVLAAAHCLLWYADVYEIEDEKILWEMNVPDEPAAQRFLPLDRKQGDTFAEALYLARLPEDREVCDDYSTACVRAGESYQQEFRCLSANGLLRWVHEDVHIETVETGKKWRAVAVCTDITERKRIETEQRESEMRKTAILNMSPDPIVSMDIAGRIVDWNPAAERCFGYSREEAIGQPMAELIMPPDLHTAHEAGFHRFMTTGEATILGKRVELTAIRRNGEVFAIELTVDCITQNGLPLFTAFLRDLTERKRAEEERRYILAGAQCLLWSADIQDLKNGQPLLWEMHYPDEEAAERFLPVKLRNGETYQSAWDRSRWPEDYERVTLQGTAFIRAGQSFEQEFRCLRADGTVRWLYESIHVETIEADRRWRAVGVCTDITERKTMEQALRESEERLQAALHAGNMGTWEWDMLSNSLKWSLETEQLFGLEPGSFGGTYEAYLQRVHPEDRDMVREIVASALRDKTSFEHESRIVLPNGAIRWVSGKGAALYGKQGEPERLLGTITDITERKRLEQQASEAHQMEGLGRLAGGIAHDFNNLLSVILGYAEMVEMELAEQSDLLPNVQNIRNAATRAAKLTSQLLAFARKQVSAAKVISPNDVIAGMNPILKPLIREDIQLVTLLKEGVGNIKADPTQIEQILVNLVVNSRDAMPNGGKIILQTDNVAFADHAPREHSTVAAGEYILISVSDTGIGMTRETRNRLFEPFFTTKSVGKGTGLGLATVYGIVKQSGGYIFAYSEVGIGTTIKVYLPRVDEIASAVSKGANLSANLNGTETILVVEDEQSVRDLTVKTLLKKGYHVLQAENGVHALRVAEAYPGEIHLVVTDAIMPEMGGRELVDRLKTARPSTIVLYVSGYTEEVTSAQGILPEGTEFVQKPFTSHGLLSKVRELLQSAP